MTDAYLLLMLLQKPGNGFMKIMVTLLLRHSSRQVLLLLPMGQKITRQLFEMSLILRLETGTSIVAWTTTWMKEE